MRNDHYVDDIITFGPPPLISMSGEPIQDSGKKLGITMAPEKTVGPSTCLGIEVNSITQTLRLHEEKLSSADSVGRKEIMYSQGPCMQGGTARGPGQTFLCYLTVFVKGSHCPYHHVRISKGCRADLKWWSVFAWRWNGVSCFPVEKSSVISMISDASGR